LPKQIDALQRCIQAISPAKDVDGFSYPVNVGKASRRRPGHALVCPVRPLAAMILIETCRAALGVICRASMRL
jgi:5,10-methylene-tetrahydrofolate dehydrogenase/methenyl tetrahydrofolate cyclohydrolase